MTSGGHNQKSEIGNRYNKLLVIEKAESSKRGLARWKCNCDCGNECVVSGYDLRLNRVKSCGCLQHRNKKGAASPRFTGYKELSGSFWCRLINNAKRRNLPMTITQEYVWEIYQQQKGLCNLSGVPIKFESSDLSCKGNTNVLTVSVDRIDNKKGYIIGNIQLIHKDLNSFRAEKTLDEFIDWCKKVAKHHES